MREFIAENMAGSSMDILTIVLNNIVAVAVALFMMFAYRITYSGVAYSRRFNVSLGAITITTTMIMGVISNNIALSLGMVGALSIIRFRTAVKDVRDAAYIFWAVAVGIGCGVAQYTYVAVGSVFMLGFMVFTRRPVSVGQQLLIIHCLPAAGNSVLLTVDKHFDGKAHLSVKNASAESCELVYRVSDSVLKRAERKQMSDTVEVLMKLEGVLSVNIMEQQDDMSR